MPNQSEQKRYKTFTIETYGWPVMRFNAALSFAKFSAYSQAIDQMKCYLKFSPHAFNVRIAKDKIAEWEIQVPRSLDNV